jgi:pimeloyl-ACP methyl ester carboxylesterase
VERPWGRVRVWEQGSGTPLLAVHGLGGSGRYWQGLADAVGDRYRVVAPDLGGFGGSTKPRARYDRAFHLETLDAVMPDADGVVVAGHSLGGVLAFLWAARHTGSVRALAMHATPYPSPNPDWDPARWGGRRSWLPRTVVAAARAAWPVLSLPAQGFSGYPRPIVRDYGRQTLRSRSLTLWALWSDPALGSVVDDAARTLPSDVRIALAHAADDRSVSLTNLARWGETLPGAERIVVPEGGHQFLLRQRFAPVTPWLRAL